MTNISRITSLCLLGSVLFFVMYVYSFHASCFEPGSPLEGIDPVEDKLINSVFDRSLENSYEANNRVEAYSGEVGELEYGVIDTDCYMQESAEVFVLDGNYKGAYGEYYLCYDGHTGIDFSVNNVWVQAIESGTVTRVENTRSNEPDTSCACLGNFVEITHDGGYVSRYGHLNGGEDVLVEEGQKVQQGQRIAISGNSGVSYGPHLHLELKRPPDVEVDPFDFWSPPPLSTKFTSGDLVRITQDGGFCPNRRKGIQDANQVQ